METLSYEEQEVKEEYRSVGGRGLTSLLLLNEVNPKAHPLNKANKLVIAPGLLSGTTAPCSGRLSMGAKSPLTYGIKESNSGGSASQYLAGHGMKGLIIENKSDKKGLVIYISRDGVGFNQHMDLIGCGNYETVSKLKEIYGQECSIISVGSAGDFGATIATLAVTDLEGRPVRHAARGGMGAVAASKGLKAIVIQKPENNWIKPKNKREFSQCVKKFAQDLINDKKTMTTYGTPVLVNAINSIGGLPHHNFTYGQSEYAEKISGESLHEQNIGRGGKASRACSKACVIRCSNVVVDSNSKYVTASLEFETIGLLGTNCGIYDLDQIAQMDRICDDIGVDTIEVGGAVGVAMESGVLNFGNFEQMKNTLLQINNKKDLVGRMIAHGAGVTGRMLGIERVPVAKNQTIAAYDPRVLKGTGVTYATSPMGGDHTAGNVLPGRGGIDHKQADGQVELSKDLQVNTMICDYLGLCIFVGPVQQNIPIFAEMVSAFEGKIITSEDLLEKAKDILKAEIEFNRQAGFTAEDNDLPQFFRDETLLNSDLVFDVDQAQLKNITFD